MQIDMLKETTVEGIVIWNWEILTTSVNNMIFSKRYLLMGTKTFSIFHRSSKNTTWTAYKTSVIMKNCLSYGPYKLQCLSGPGCLKNDK
jgi:hypothetical protein